MKQPHVLQKGQEAFDDWVHRFQTDVFNVAYRMLGDAQDAEDAVQETFLKAYRSFQPYDAQRPPGPWLKKIAANVCLDRLSRRQPLPLDEEYPFSSSEPGPEWQSLARERNRRVRDALLSLPPRYRMVIELRHFQELSYAEMAEELGRPLSDIKFDLFRARQVLSRRLKDVK